MYKYPQDVFYYPKGDRVEYASSEEAIAAYVGAHFPGASELKRCDDVARTGYPHAVAFVDATGVEHGVYLERAGDKWVVAATSDVVPPERLTPNSAETGGVVGDKDAADRVQDFIDEITDEERAFLSAEMPSPGDEE